MIATITLGVVRFASVFGLCENGCGAHAFIQPAHHCLAGSRVIKLHRREVIVSRLSPGGWRTVKQSPDREAHPCFLFPRVRDALT